MTAVLDGVRILKVAEHTFVPAASAGLADLGAEVSKIVHVLLEPTPTSSSSAAMDQIVDLKVRGVVA